MKAFMLVDRETKEPIQYYRESPSMGGCLLHILKRVTKEEVVYHDTEMFVEVNIELMEAK